MLWYAMKSDNLNICYEIVCYGMIFKSYAMFYAVKEMFELTALDYLVFTILLLCIFLVFAKAYYLYFYYTFIENVS